MAQVTFQFFEVGLSECEMRNPIQCHVYSVLIRWLNISFSIWPSKGSVENKVKELKIHTDGITECDRRALAIW